MRDRLPNRIPRIPQGEDSPFVPLAVIVILLALYFLS